MSPAEAIGAIERLVGVAKDYPELASGVIELVETVLKPKASEPKIFERNGHLPAFSINGFHSNGRAINKPRIDFPEPGPVDVKDWYTVYEFGDVVGRNFQTVAQWCRRGQIRAEKVETHGSGVKPWRISAKELARYKASGLLGINIGRN